MIISSCLAQSYKFTYRNIPRDLVSTTSVFQSVNLDGYVDLDSYFSKENEREDNTDLLQNLVNKYKKIVMPDFAITVNKKGITIPANREIYFRKNSSILLKGNNQTNYQILRLHNVANIKLYNPQIIGDRKTHFGTVGEWGMGISVVSARNIKIYNAQVSNCWGDGIYIAGNSYNISIKFGVLDNNRRNNISVVSVDSLLIDRIFLSNANGTNPQSGLLFEPNNGSNKIKSVYVNNIITYNNAFSGLGFTLKYAYDSDSSLSRIVINNPVDYYSRYSLNSELSPKKGVSINNRFVIEINNPKWYDSFDFIRTDNYYNSKIQIKLKNVIMSKGKNNLSILSHRVFKNRTQENSVRVDN